MGTRRLWWPPKETAFAPSVTTITGLGPPAEPCFPPLVPFTGLAMFSLHRPVFPNVYTFLRARPDGLRAARARSKSAGAEPGNPTAGRAGRDSNGNWEVRGSSERTKVQKWARGRTPGAGRVSPGQPRYRSMCSASQGRTA